MSDDGCLHVVVMGVAGSGKTSVATAVGAELGLEVIDGDAYHPAVNIEKMTAGIPLTDDDRLPWLERLAALIAEQHAHRTSTILACSALRREYRDVLRTAVPVETFILQLDVEKATLRSRMSHRQGHYMPVSLLTSQLATLEPLEADERGIRLEADQPLDAVIAGALAAVRSAAGPQH